MTDRHSFVPFTTYQAAQELGVTQNRIRQLIRAGRLPATKNGRDWLIMYGDLDKVRERKPGKPKQQEGDR